MVAGKVEVVGMGEVTVVKGVEAGLKGEDQVAMGKGKCKLQALASVGST